MTLVRYGPWALGTAALFIALAAFALAWAGLNPVRETGNTLPEVLGLNANACPAGWKSAADDGYDSIVRRCERDGWIVFLDDQGQPTHAGFKEAGQIVRFVCIKGHVPPDCLLPVEAVPGWSD